MGTRGLVGFHRGGRTKAQYNHFDSYPVGLGYDVLETLRGTTVEHLLEVFDRIEVVDGKEPAPPEAQERYRTVADTGVSAQSLFEWYCLLRNAQGGIAPWVSGTYDHMIDGADFINDSLFCEYAYIVDLDEQRFEAYRGFQEQPHTDGRYAKPEPNDGGYYPCRLIASWPLQKLPTEDELSAAFRTEDEKH